MVVGSIETITLGDKRIGIRTSVLEEKATACNMLCCYADGLKEGFFPWIDQVIFSLTSHCHTLRYDAFLFFIISSESIYLFLCFCIVFLRSLLHWCLS
jgi:hypothetical protein